MLDGDLPDDPPDRVYLCADDEEAALKLALTMDHFWHRGPRSLVQTGEELCNDPPDFRATRQAPPGRADEADQTEALVDRHAIVLARLAHSVDK